MTPVISDAQRTTAVHYALSLVGKATYQLNAPMTGNAFDCSSFTKRAWAAAGVTIPRNSLDQADQLLSPNVLLLPVIQRNWLKRKIGDLVFYYSKDWSHVAMICGVESAAHPYIDVVQATNEQRGIEVIRVDAYTPSFALGFMGHI